MRNELQGKHTWRSGEVRSRLAPPLRNQKTNIPFPVSVYMLSAAKLKFPQQYCAVCQERSSVPLQKLPPYLETVIVDACIKCSLFTSRCMRK